MQVLGCIAWTPSRFALPSHRSHAIHLDLLESSYGKFNLSAMLTATRIVRMHNLIHVVCGTCCV